ncbi:MAG TPA: hypothetical protein VGP05_25360 [Pseudonocardia sp.]|nr:hypothetical protein [Pseudonocardia sp.]
MIDPAELVYWRRRAIAVAAVLGVVLLVVWAVSGPSQPAAPQTGAEMNTAGSEPLAFTPPAAAGEPVAPPSAQPVPSQAALPGAGLPSGLATGAPLPGSGLPGAAPGTGPDPSAPQPSGLPGAPAAPGDATLAAGNPGLPGSDPGLNAANPGMTAGGSGAPGLAAGQSGSTLPSGAAVPPAGAYGSSLPPRSALSGSQQAGSPQAGSRLGSQPGSMQRGSTQRGSTQAGSTQAGSMQPGSLQAGSMQPGATQPGSPRSARPGALTSPGTAARPGYPAGTNSDFNRGQVGAAPPPSVVPPAPMAPDGPNSAVPGTAAAPGYATAPGDTDPAAIGSGATKPAHGGAHGPKPNAVPVVAKCTDQDLALVSQVAAANYKVGQKPMFRLVIANIGEKPCSRDLDPGLQGLVINGPAGQMWASNDCDANHKPDVRVLDPGKPVVFSLSWAGRTSHPGCGGTRQAVGPGTYQLVGKLGPLSSGPAPFTLTP